MLTRDSNFIAHALTQGVRHINQCSLLNSTLAILHFTIDFNYENMSAEVCMLRLQIQSFVAIESEMNEIIDYQ